MRPSRSKSRCELWTTGWPAGPIPGGCYTIDSTAALPFVVCDNNAGAVPQSNVCMKDGTQDCTDDDPAFGSLRVAVTTGFYDVSAASAPGHRLDAHVKFCDIVGAGMDVKCRFNHTPVTRPWFPWDLDGNGFVTGIDFFQLIGHFGDQK